MESKSEDINEVEIDPLKWLYYQKKGDIIKEAEVILDDITPEFDLYLEDKIKAKELLNIANIGEVAGSKSTSAIAIMHKVNKIYEDVYGKDIDRFRCIFADQIEFVRFIKTKAMYRCIVIDEFSRMGETGYNATTGS